MRRVAQESIRQEDVFFTVVSPKASLSDCGPERIVADAAQVGVRLAHQPVDAVTHVFGVPDQIETYSVVIGYGQLDEDILRLAEDSEWLVEDRSPIALGIPAITFRGKVHTDPVIDFLGMTLCRVLGRLTHGVLVTGPNGVVNDEWLSWSLDYMDRDTFKITRVYDESCPNFLALADRFPLLRVPMPSK